MDTASLRPSPAIGYLIHYDLLDGRGGVVKQGSFPDSKQIWPRLRYHRFLMLASQCEVPAATESESKRWQQAILGCYARELFREKSDCQAVRVQRIDHIPLFQREALQNMRPDDPTKFKRKRKSWSDGRIWSCRHPCPLRAVPGTINFAVTWPADGRESDDEWRNPRICIGRVGGSGMNSGLRGPIQPRCH